jgi:AraC-like DNA-binding protein
MLIEDLIDRQIWSQKIGLEILAQELGMSSSTLKRRLSKLKTSYREMLLGRRLHQARRLIDNSDLSIGRIAKILGYTAVSNFSRTFHSATGYYPTELRRLSTEARSLIKYNYSNLIGPQ